MAGDSQVPDIFPQSFHLCFFELGCLDEAGDWQYVVLSRNDTLLLSSYLRAKSLQMKLGNWLLG